MKTALALATILLASTAHAASYGPYPEQTFTTCGNPTSKIAVELIHGGGEYRDDMSSMPIICKFLGDRGAYVITVGYRLATQGQGWPAQWQDTQLGVRWLRSQGYKRVGMVGASAGGYNVLGATLTFGTIFAPAVDPKGEAALYPEVSSVPDFAVDISGFTDLSDARLPENIEPALTNGMGMAKAMNDATASAVTYAQPKIPPLLIIHGLNDNIVPVSQSQELVTRLRAMGGNAKLVITTGKHVFLGLSATERNAVLKQIADCVGGVVICK